MSLSKNIKHYRLSLSLARQLHSGNSAAEAPKMTTATKMSLAHWRIINQLKEFYARYSSDNQVLNKEFASFLQRMQPSVYGNEIFRNLETKAVAGEPVKHEEQIPENNPTVEKPAEKPKEGFLNNFKLKIGKQEQPNVQVVVPPVPKWKSEKKDTVSKNSIFVRTVHVISMIACAENDISMLHRVEELSSHLLQYPEAKHHAVKEGAVRILLRIRKNTQNPEIHAAVNEAFAILGYSKTLPGRGIRILSIDGGGTRGLLVIQMLKKLEEITGKKIHELFDLLCGVSTGAIITCALGASQKDLTNLTRYYKDLSVKIFSQNAFWGTSSLVFSHSYYDTKVWEQTLQEYFGDIEMIKTSRNPNCPKVAAVSTVVNQSRTTAYVFRNYQLPYRVQSEYMGGSNHKVWEAVRASAAAPTYFEEFKIGNLLHQDGGIMVNNPTSVAIHEARLLWPDSPIQCVVSFGTGRTNPMHSQDLPTDNSKGSSWKNKFLKILDSATDTESVHTILNDLLPPNVYYRFNPYLTEMVEMSENRPEKLEQLEKDAVMYLHRNEDKFQMAAKKLMEQRTILQKTTDWVNTKREMVGISVP